MAVSIDWATKVIFVPRADLTLIQATPTEIREHDLNAFRLELRSLEDDEEGMPYVKTHKHNTEVTLGGLTYARIVEIINDYTITYEDGQYAVNLVGANSNVADRVNVNQVSVRSANSAGMITSKAIEFSEFSDGVVIDQGNRTGHAVTGSVYPTGTLRQPALDIADAIVIANARGVFNLSIIGSATFGAGHNIDGFRIHGTTEVQSSVTVASATDASQVVITDLDVSGTLDGDTDVRNCTIGALTYVNGHIHNSNLNGKITLDGGADCTVTNCNQLSQDTIPEIDMGGSGQDLFMDEYGGDIKISNMTGAGDTAYIGLAHGKVILDSTVTNGTVRVSGNGRLVDGTGTPIDTGTWNGATIINGLVSRDTIPVSVWAYER